MSLLSPALDSERARALQPLNLSNDLVFDLALFLLPIMGIFSFQVMGEVLLSDLAAPLLLAVAISVRGLPKTGIVYLLFAGAALWVLSLVASDMVNNSKPHDYLRGWARNGLGCFYLAAVVCTLRPQLRSFAMVVAGLAVCLAVKALMGQRLRLDWFIKMGGGSALDWLLCIFTMYRFRQGRPLLPIILFVVLTALALAMNVRSNMAISFTVGFLCTAAFYGHRLFSRVTKPVLLVLLLAAGGVMAGGLASIYSTLASTGALGEGAEQKFEFQARGASNLAQVWNARPELRVALAVISDSPWLGHGSWYRDPRIAAAELLFSDYAAGATAFGGVTTGIVRSGGGEAMGHSIILQSWVEAGILGAAFWFAVLIICISAILGALQKPNALSPVVFMAAVSLSWDAIFSPFAGIQRVTNMVELAIVLIAIGVSVRPHSNGVAESHFFPGRQRRPAVDRPRSNL